MNTPHISRHFTALVSLLAACTAAAPDDGTSIAGGKTDRWDAENDPARFGGELSYRLDELPLDGRSARPAWPSTYWPTSEDSINVRWNEGELSPAEKYDLAFNDWRPGPEFSSLRRFVPGVTCERMSGSFDPEYYEQLGPLARWVARNLGNWRAHDFVDSDMDGRIDECSDNDGIQGWWGICHAWTPAAILEDMPLHAVTYRGVTFEVGDLQALIIAAYNHSRAAIIGGRCDDRPVERDENGRPTDGDCRDTNPGSFHVVAANYLGLQQRAFAEDRTYDDQVWNQPVVAYRVRKLEDIDVAAANALLGLTGDAYELNPDAQRLVYVETTTTYVAESGASRVAPDPRHYEREDDYTYILELDASGKIIGGEWVGASRFNHPDFLWSPQRHTRSSVPGLDIDQVRMLIEMSRTPVGGPSTTDVRELASSDGPIEIPDADERGITSRISVGDPTPIGAVRVALEITHPYAGDLTITLMHGDVARTVWNREGGSDDDIRTTIEVPGFTGDAQGDWVLTVADTAAQDTGTLEGWKLILAPL